MRLHLTETSLANISRFIMSLLAVFSLRCQEEVVISSQDALVDARFAPKIIFAAPAMNSVGPYLQWGDFPSPEYTILLRFNKLMDPVSIRSGLRLRSSVRPVVLYGGGAIPREMTERFTLIPVDDGGVSLAAPRIGEVFTLSADSTVTDINGNTMAAGVLGTIVPEPAFRVRGLLPIEWELASTQERVTLVFNSAVDSSIVRAISVSPPAGASWVVDPYDSTTVSTVVSGFPPGVECTISVAAGARNKAGDVMPSAFSSKVRTLGFALMSISYTSGTALPRLEEGVYFYFSMPVDGSTAAGAVHIDPPLAGGLKFSSWHEELKVAPWTSFAPEEYYTITVDTALHAVGGLGLRHPVTVGFRTSPFTGTFSLPANGLGGVSTSRDIMIEFTAMLDTSTARGAFSISPPVDGEVYCSRLEPYNLFFAVTDSFKAFTTYTVRIDSTLKSRGGYALSRPYTMNFTTGGQYGTREQSEH